MSKYRHFMPASFFATFWKESLFHVHGGMKCIPFSLPSTSSLNFPIGETPLSLSQQRNSNSSFSLTKCVLGFKKIQWKYLSIRVGIIYKVNTFEWIVIFCRRNHEEKGKKEKLKISLDWNFNLFSAHYFFEDCIASLTMYYLQVETSSSFLEEANRT